MHGLVNSSIATSRFRERRFGNQSGLDSPTIGNMVSSARSAQNEDASDSSASEASLGTGKVWRDASVEIQTEHGLSPFASLALKFKRNMACPRSPLCPRLSPFAPSPFAPSRKTVVHLGPFSLPSATLVAELVKSFGFCRVTKVLTTSATVLQEDRTAEKSRTEVRNLLISSHGSSGVEMASYPSQLMGGGEMHRGLRGGIVIIVSRSQHTLVSNLRKAKRSKSKTRKNSADFRRGDD